MGYREQGYEKTAFINMLAFLGWNPGTEKEIFSLDELVDEFSLERVHKAGAKFDADKTKWFNQQHLKGLTDQFLRIAFSDLLKKREIPTHYSDEKLEMICFMMKDRITFLQDIYLETPYLFGAIDQYDPQIIEKKWKADASPKIIGDLHALFQSIDAADFYAENLERFFKQYLEQNQVPMGLGMISLRLILTGKGNGPSLFQIAEGTRQRLLFEENGEAGVLGGAYNRELDAFVLPKHNILHIHFVRKHSLASCFLLACRLY